MKKNYKKIALLAVLSLAATSCQKEDVLPLVGTEQTSETIPIVCGQE